MKMVALGQQDASDIAALAKMLDMTSAPSEQFSGLLQTVYNGEGVLAQVLGVPDDHVDDETDAIARRVAAFLAAQPPP